MDEILVYDGPGSVRPAKQGRSIDYEWESKQKHVYLTWPEQYRRQWRPMRSPKDGHVLSDDEINMLLSSIRQGFKASRFESTEMLLEYLTYREQVIDTTRYGAFEGDVTVCRFFTAEAGEKQENMLQDIRDLNAKQGMGNIKIPGTNIEMINYSPCPKCNTPHSFADVFMYYQHPTPDPSFSSLREQMRLDTRVQCKECGEYFLPAIIITDGSPKNEFQMICRSQTLREVSVMMSSKYHLRVLMMKEENIMINGDQAAWRNDVDANLLKERPSLFTNFLQYTPAPLMLDFISKKNLEEREPVYGAWMPKEHVSYQEMY